ncbi:MULTISPECIES: DMT family transporter [unclassified Roseovarius]|uniref:DMT family transporter n=1 Tax=unclassified Roseovarius TaxID=2614913 RepID=UPI0027402C5A|nr:MULTISPECIES: DMT family transporter [unclassified Roseovarius]
MTQSVWDKPGNAPGKALRGNAICVAAVALFATGFPAAEELLKTWGPISLITARLVLACALLLLMWIIADGWRRVVAAPLLRGLIIGATGFGAGAILMLVAQDLTDPVTAVLTAATMPVTAVALEVLFDGRRLTRNFVIGTCLVLLGGYLATGVDLRQVTYGGGILLGLLATAQFAWGSRKAIKGLPEMSALGQCTITLCGAMLFAIATLAVFEMFGWSGTDIAPLGPWGWSMLLLYSLVAMAISQAFWILGVSHLGIGIASFHLNAAPFYVMLILLALGEVWDWNRALGAAILAVGVVLAQQRRAA